MVRYLTPLANGSNGELLTGITSEAPIRANSGNSSQYSFIRIFELNKQELTVHTTNKTPLVLQMLQGEHFGAAAQEYTNGDEKIYGPFFIYVNSGNSRDAMIEDAKHQASTERSLWPYPWLINDLYPLERSKVRGQINLPYGLSPDSIQVVLAQPDAEIYDAAAPILAQQHLDRHRGVVQAPAGIDAGPETETYIKR